MIDASVRAEDSGGIKQKRARARKGQYICSICRKEYLTEEDLSKHNKAYESFHKKKVVLDESASNSSSNNESENESEDESDQDISVSSPGDKIPSESESDR
jgi:hypothetical protein